MPIGLKGNTDGSGAIQIGGSDAITISTGLNTTFAGTITSSTGTTYPVVSGTAVASTSGTSIDFTGIPSWVKRITVMFNGVSTNGTSSYQVQLGYSGGIENTGYVGNSSETATGAAGSTSYAGAGFVVTRTTTAASLISGSLTLVNVSGNVWVGSSVLAASAATTTYYGAGNKTISGGTLDRVRITTVNGTDTFDAGTINILYE